MHRMKCALAAVLLAATLAGCGGHGAAPRPHVEPLFSLDRVWDDGQAEVATYSGTTLRYGTERSTDTKFYLVKEDLLEATLVKSDSGAVQGRTVEALKLNEVIDYPTGTYAYHQMASVFARRSDLELLKETMSSTEGCGITFVRVGPKGGRLVHTAHSYREGEADREVAIETTHAPLWWADALPLTLRGLAGETKPFERRVWLLPSQLDSRSPLERTRPVEAIVRLVETVPLSVPDGAYAARHFTVTTEHGTDLYWFDVEGAHVMLKMETADGRKLELVNVVRLAYWEHTAPGEERLLLE